MTEVQIWEAQAGDAPALKVLVQELYLHQSRLGSSPRLKPGGEEDWFRSYESLLGTYAVIFCAGQGLADSFMACRVRTPPSYIDAPLRAVVSECYVDPCRRRQGLARLMFERAKAWFAAKGLLEWELQTTYGNEAAEACWRACGFEREWTQWRMLET
jgi:GNAT superfamily N-acetyltransferase